MGKHGSNVGKENFVVSHAHQLISGGLQVSKGLSLPHHVAAADFEHKLFVDSFV